MHLYLNRGLQRGEDPRQQSNERKVTMKFTRTAKLAALLSASALVLAGTGVATAAHAAGSGAKVYVIGGMPSDPFWSVVKRGAEAAGKAVEAAGGSVTWLGPQNYDNLGPDAGKLVDTAVSNGADAIVIADWVPQAENPAIKRAIAAKIPVIIYNAGGVAQVKATGALTYIGSDETVAGKAGGVYFATHGAKNILCVNTVPGSANQEARCAGVAAGAKSKGAKSKQLPLPSSNFGNPTAVSNAIKAALTKDKTIDAVITIGVQDADSAAAAIKAAGKTKKVKLGTFDLSKTQLDRITSGEQLFAIDQQPWLQGYLAASVAWQYFQYGIKPATSPVLTGPALVTSANVAVVKAGVAAGVR
jgi:simple sugar transport system substrate-binding protein